MKDFPLSPTAELEAFTSRFAATCRAKGWLGALFHVGVITDIAADLRAWLNRRRDLAHKCEIGDLEAAKLLEREAQITSLSKKDRAMLRQAVAMIRRNASRGHDLSEQLST